MPSVRSIKREYHLSTSSVQRGYDDLVFRGLVNSNPRSGYTVAARSGQAPEETLARPPVQRDPDFEGKVTATSDRRLHFDYAALNEAAPSDFLVPQKLLLRTMQGVIREKGAALLRYYPANGSEELRGLLCRRSAVHGALIQPEELLITDGALQALFIALASVTAPGDVIAVESPCVFSILEVIANLRLKAVEIPVRDKDGPDTDYLKKPVGVALIKQSNVFPEVLEGRRIRTFALFYILPEHDTEESRRSLWEKCLSISTNLDAIWLEVHQDDPLVPFFKSNGFVIHRESLMPFAQPSYILIRYRTNR
ncbi:hypothetical protein GCM10023091_19430 [Ravibacter arvi]|uniref:Uncharacterized protein n=1 Tax=Ravibacter arvi TaxID=2051041 RepID=A0ABP8LZF7_9BACT